jgi:hypothetical protein
VAEFVFLDEDGKRQGPADGEVAAVGVVELGLGQRLVQHRDGGETLDRFVCQFRDPEGHSHPSVFEDEVAKVVEVHPVVVVGLQVLDQLLHVPQLVLLLGWLLQVDRLDHRLGRSPLLDGQQFSQLPLVDLLAHTRNLTISQHMLQLPASQQVRVLVHVQPALVAELVPDLHDMFFPQHSQRGVIELLAALLAACVFDQSKPLSVLGDSPPGHLLELGLAYGCASEAEALLHRVVAVHWPVVGGQVQPLVDHGMLEIGWEKELLEGLERNLVGVVDQFGYLLGDVELEDVAFFVGLRVVVAAPEFVSQEGGAELCAEAFRVLLAGLVGVHGPDNLLPEEDGVTGFMAEQQGTALPAEQVLCHFFVEGGLLVAVEQVGHLLGEEHPLQFFLYKEALLVDGFEDGLQLGGIQAGIRLDKGHGVGQVLLLRIKKHE